MGRGKKIVKECKHCKKDFEALLIKVRQGKGLFCNTECYKDFRKKNSLDPKKRAVIHQKKYKYGLSEEAYLGLFIKQDNKCAICKKELEGIKACVDHNHNNNEVRGILCDKCNRGLGFFEDNIISLKCAIKYLNKGR